MHVNPLVFSSLLVVQCYSFIAPQGPRQRSTQAPALRQRAAATMMAQQGLKVGIVGATGAVGEEILQLHLYASARSAGKKISTSFGDVTIEEFSVTSASKLDILLLAVGGEFATQYAQQLSEGDGPIVIDNSSAFRLDPNVPLVIPEINKQAAKGKKLIANPNCTTAVALMALYPLHLAFGLKKVIMSTYQAASGAGAEGMTELENGVRQFAKGEKVTNKFFAYQLPFNVIPHIDVVQENLYTKEEMKVTWETRKILGIDDLAVSCTAVRIPTLRAHSESITIETDKPVSREAAREVLSKFPGVKVVDDTANKQYPMPLTATGQFDIEVGRIRQSIVFGDHGLDIFVVGDQLLRGAALNAVLIAENVDRKSLANA